MKINDVLDQVGKDILTEDTKKLLAEAFEEAVKASVSEKVTLEVENALKQLDEEHSQKLNKLLESIDGDHTKKLMVVLEKIDIDHTQKLQKLVEYYKRVMAEDANVFKKQLVEKVSNYLDLYIADKIPQAEIQEAVQNVKARKMVDQIKQIVSLDDEYISETIKEAVEDGAKTIEELRKELNEAMKTNIEVAQAKKNVSAQLIIEKKTAGFSKDKKDFVVRVLRDKDPEVIEENFNYVLKMFEKEESENKETILEESKKTSKTVSGKVDVPVSKIKDTSLVTESNGDSVGEYLKVLTKQDGK